ncbi:MAG: UDP-N-acetylglucosamine--N-acetylmuramyl-(pentapeptide) pyrophosphoryl-undecaprenol N-acetylglucosamine transferase [Chlamydiales bacterium]|nr:UDP-N-acetylglucosamine--N-acetylmuramyl-(pentapeptide) pyrophosphoryl-undecaprenol N-acetylglucosamine transferase [Chlamydiales bacterium]
MTRSVLIAVGGSGGHLLPAQQLAKILQQESQVTFAGFQLSKSPFFQKESFFFQDIEAAPLAPFTRFLRKSSKGVMQSLRLLRTLNPDVVIGFGSYHAFPILAAAVLLRKKILLYEANCVLGKVNRLFSPFADLLAIQFPLEKPVRRNYQYASYFPWVKNKEAHTKQEALQSYGLNGTLPVCLVFGGSQGAAFFNETAPIVLSGCQVIHCTGSEETVENVRSLYQGLQIRAFVQSFESDMAKAYAAADFALCRSGAATISELIQYQVPAVLVPFPYAADGHQEVNARFFCSSAQGGVWLAQRERELLSFKVQECLKRQQEFGQSLQLFYQKTKKRIELADLVREIW